MPLLIAILTNVPSNEEKLKFVLTYTALTYASEKDCLALISDYNPPVTRERARSRLPPLQPVSNPTSP